MGRLLSTLGITFFGTFSFASGAEPTQEIEFNQKEINKEIKISLSQSMEEMMINLFNDDHQTILIAKKDEKSTEASEKLTEE